MDPWQFRFNNTPYKNADEEDGTVDYTLPFDDMPVYPYNPIYEKNQSVFSTDAGGARVYSRSLVRKVSMRWDSAEEEVKNMIQRLFLEHLPFDFYEDVHGVRSSHLFDVPRTRCLIVSSRFTPRELVDMSFAFSITITEVEGKRLPL